MSIRGVSEEDDESDLNAEYAAQGKEAEELRSKLAELRKQTGSMAVELSSSIVSKIRSPQHSYYYDKSAEDLSAKSLRGRMKETADEISTFLLSEIAEKARIAADTSFEDIVHVVLYSGFGVGVSSKSKTQLSAREAFSALVEAREGAPAGRDAPSPLMFKFLSSSSDKENLISTLIKASVDRAKKRIKDQLPSLLKSFIEAVANDKKFIEAVQKEVREKYAESVWENVQQSFESEVKKLEERIVAPADQTGSGEVADFIRSMVDETLRNSRKEIISIVNSELTMSSSGSDLAVIENDGDDDESDDSDEADEESDDDS